MAGADEGGKGLAGQGDQRFLKGDTLVARQHRLPRADLAVTTTNDSWHMRDLIPSSFAHAHAAAQELERRQEEVRDEMWLEPPRLRSLHLFADRPDLAGIQRITSQCPLLEELTQPLAVQRIVHRLVEPGAHLRLVAVANSPQHQFA